MTSHIPFNLNIFTSYTNFIQILDGPGCKVSIIHAIEFNTGISDMDLKNILIYPNPTVSSFNLKNLPIQVNLSVINQTGKVVYPKLNIEQSELTLDLPVKFFYLQLTNQHQKRIRLRPSFKIRFIDCIFEFQNEAYNLSIQI